MKIYSWNVNGIRASYEKGLGNFLKKENPDVLCLQEIKANESQFPESLNKKGYNLYVNAAQKPGYSGVAVFSKTKPKKIESKIGHRRFDTEGRFLRLDFKDYILINIYLPHGGRDKSKLRYKLDVYKRLLSYLEKIKSKKVILIGDFNIAHIELDLARPKQNQNNIMFTPKERKQIDNLISLGFVDSFREFNHENENYTWWPYMANARERNLGWRIDYCFVSQPLQSNLRDAFICPKVLGSDHCPIGIEV